MAADSLSVHSSTTFDLISFMNNINAFSGFFTWTGRVFLLDSLSRTVDGWRPRRLVTAAGGTSSDGPTANTGRKVDEKVVMLLLLLNKYSPCATPLNRLEQRPGCGYKEKQMANSCCPLSCLFFLSLPFRWQGKPKSDRRACWPTLSRLCSFCVC